MPATWTTVRIFISSTFRDMHAERDWLVRFVFQRLREELRVHIRSCAQRFDGNMMNGGF